MNNDWMLSLTLDEILDYNGLTLDEFIEDYDYLLPPRPVDASIE